MFFCLLAAGYGPQQTFELAASAAPMAASSSPSWHGASPIYASSCARHYDDWPPNAAVNSAAIAGPAHSPNSPGGQYLLANYKKMRFLLLFGLYSCFISDHLSSSKWSIDMHLKNFVHSFAMLLDGIISSTMNT